MSRDIIENAVADARQQLRGWIPGDPEAPNANTFITNFVENRLTEAGLGIVPVEPTEAMVTEARKHLLHLPTKPNDSWDADDIARVSVYKAMIGAGK